MKKSYLLDELDQVLSIIGIIFSLLLTIWLHLVIERPLYVIIGLLCLIVCTVYLILRRYIHPSFILSLDKLECNNDFYLILNIFFFLLLSYSIIIIYINPEPYVRPLEYFISTAIISAILSMEILFLSPKKSHIYVTLCKIILIGLSLQYSQVLIFPSIVGIDTWWHQWFTLKMLNDGYILEGLGYSKLPLMHLMIGIASLLTDLNYKMTAMITISFLQVVCDTLYIFLLGKYLINTKIGLMAALLLESANHHIRFGYWVMPNTMGSIFILSTIFILFKIKSNKPISGNFIVMLLMSSLILTHTISALCLSILLFIFWFSSLVYNRIFHQITDISVTLKICILYTTVMFSYWIFISGDIITFINLIEMEFSNPLWMYEFDAFSYIPLWEQIFNNIGMFFYFSISFLGCLYVLSKQFRNSTRVITLISGMFILSLAFFSLVAGKTIITHRWYYFSQILLSIPLALSIFLVNGIIKHRIKKGLVISILVLILTFFLIISPEANNDNRIFSTKSTVRFAFTDSELQGGNTISTKYNVLLGTDSYYGYLLKYQLNIKYISIDDYLNNGDFSVLKNILIIVRDETMNYPIFRPNQSPLIIDYNISLKLEEQNFSKIYDCGSISGYFKP